MPWAGTSHASGETSWQKSGRLPARGALGLFSAMLFAVYVAIAAVTPLVHPEYNWDTIAYVAVMEEPSIADAGALHEQAYAAVRDATPTGKFQPLVSGNDYRIRQAEDPGAFQSMLPMYRVKPLYVAVARALSSSWDAVTALRMVNVIAAVLTGFVLMLWLGRERAVVLAAPLAILLGLAAWPHMLRAVTPDMLGAAVVLAAAFAHVRRAEALVFVLLVAAYFIRPDNLAFIGLLAAAGFMLRDMSWGAVAALAVTVLSYGPLSQWAGHGGWWPHFWFGTVEYVPDLRGFDPDFSLSVYLVAVLRGAGRAVIEGLWPLLAVSGILAWALLRRSGLALGRREAALAGAALAAIAAKFLIFPLYDGRIYFPLSILPLLLVALAFHRSHATAHVKPEALP